MKTTLKNIFGWGSVLVFVAGFSSTAFAGPGPQFWQQQAKGRAENPAKVQPAAFAAKAADTSAMTCASCKTTDIAEYRGSQAGGKVPASNEIVGTKHTCAVCGGAIATVRGNTTSDMKGNCPICTKAKSAAAACCNTTG